AFRQEEAATQQTLQEEPVAAVAPVVEPDPIDESDDDVERAFAALEAWEHGRPIRRGASVVPVIDERQIAGMGATAGSAA
ncbi:hypothetical protein AAAB31_09905, partial [Lactobacillus acidophilus]|uniref:hypothetical protein n=1 Tax=Lactobacillus acidophilus TaxID=1579 RepID=UPI0030F2266F